MSGQLRILVTGSRAWTDRVAVRDALLDALSTYTTIGAPVLVHGAARGADTIADEEWQAFALPLAEPERYPARGFPSPRHRNQHMVNLGATVCLAFAKRWDSGTGMCARMARRAGITVVDVGAPTAPEEVPW
jgi:hypothetical protein